MRDWARVRREYQPDATRGAITHASTAPDTDHPRKGELRDRTCRESRAVAVFCRDFISYSFVALG